MKNKISRWLAALLAVMLILMGGLVQEPAAVWAEQTSPEAAAVELEDGEYTITVDLSGGTGRASVTSPAKLMVKDGAAYAWIEWSSSHYDYMVVDGEKYLPVNADGNSVFEIPILVFDEEMTVIADTTAMSAPHEIEYALVFHEDGIRANLQTSQGAALEIIYVVILIAAVCIAMGLIVFFVFIRKRNVRK